LKFLLFANSGKCEQIIEGEWIKSRNFMELNFLCALCISISLWRFCVLVTISWIKKSYLETRKIVSSLNIYVTNLKLIDLCLLSFGKKRCRVPLIYLLDFCKFLRFCCSQKLHQIFRVKFWKINTERVCFQYSTPLLNSNNNQALFFQSKTCIFHND
jgi:hypothetical protein